RRWRCSRPCRFPSAAPSRSRSGSACFTTCRARRWPAPIATSAPGWKRTPRASRPRTERSGRMPEIAEAIDSTANGRATRRKRFTVDALFADHRPQAVGVADLTNAKEIRLDRIEPDPEQPRRRFDPDKLAELTESIRREEVLQP